MNNSLAFGKRALTMFVVATTILWTLGVAAFAAPTASAVSTGSLVKSASLSAVYYYGTDGQRYVFPNLKTYETWYTNFSGVQTVSDSEIAAMPIGGNVVYRPGARFVKIQSNNKTYAVTPNGVLRWVETEAVAVGLAGSAWNTLIDDVPDLFFTDYTVGSSLMTAAAYDGMYVTSGGSDYVVLDGAKRLLTAAGKTANGVQARFFVTPGSDLLGSLTAGADITSGNADLNDPAQLGSSVVTPVAGGLSVSLASDTPAAATIASGSSQVKLMKFNLTANSGNATLTSLTLKLAGLGATSNISYLYLYEGNTRLTNGRSVNSTTRQAVFGGMSLAVTSGQTRTLTVVADMAASLSAGDTVLVQIESASSLQSNATVSGSFPVSGNTMGTSATAVGTLTLTDTGTISNPKVGETAKIANFTLTANATEGFALSRVRLNVDKVTDHSAYELRQNNTKLADGVVSGSSYVSFTLTTPYAISSGNNREFDVYAKVGGDNGDALSVYLEETTDIYAVGDKYGYGVTVTNTSFGTAPGSCTSDASGYDCMSVQAGQLTIAFAGPTTRDIPDNTTGVVLWEGTMTAANLIEVRDMPFDITGGAGTTNLCEGACGTTSENYQNFRLVRKSTGATISGPVDMRSTTDSTAAPTTTAATVYLTDDFSIPAGESWDVQLLTDVQQVAGSSYDIASGDTIYAVLDLTTTDSAIFTARDANNKAMTVGTDIIPGADLTGNTMTVRSASLTINVASTPASQTVVKGTSNVDFVGFSMQAGTAADVTVSAITLQGATDAGAHTMDVADNTISPTSDLTSCSLYDGLTGALIDGPESFSSWTTGSKTDIIFSGFEWTVPAGQTYKMVVRCNVANYSVVGDNDKFGIEIKGASADNVTSTDEDGNAVTETMSGSNTASATSIFVTVANAGSLTVALDGDTTSSTNVLSNSTGVAVSKFKFTSSNEAFVIDRLAIDNTGGSDTAVSSVELSYKNQAGEDKVATGFLSSNTVIFNGLTMYVPKDGTAVVTVKVNTGDVTTANTGSGDTVGLDMSMDADETEFRAVGIGSGTTIDDSDVDLDGDTTYDEDEIKEANNMTIRKTKPTISLASGSPSGAAIAGLIEVLRFNVTADSRGDVTLSEAVLKFSSTANAGDSVTDWNMCSSMAVGDVYLYESTEMSTDIAANSDVTLLDTGGDSCSAEVIGYIRINLEGETTISTAQTIAAGTTKTYILKLDVSNTESPSAVNDDSMRVDIVDETTADGLAAASGNKAIEWDDANLTNGDALDVTGAYIKNLPIVGGSLIF